VNVFPFIEAERAEQRNVARACVLLKVSRSAFYVHAQHRPTARQVSDTALLERIREIHKASGGTYGWPRVRAQLAARASTRRGSGWPGSCAPPG
jgi:hypothetical protein